LRSILEQPSVPQNDTHFLVGVPADLCPETS